MRSKCIDMPTRKEKKPAPKRAKRQTTRTNRRHGPEIRLAAEIAGVTPSMVYKVKNKRAKSASVKRALKLAEEQLRRSGSVVA
jgi:hypothetical protein